MAKRVGSQLTSAFGITLGIGGVTAAITGLIALAKGAADYADSIGKAAQVTGTSTEALSAWRYGAQLANVSTEELETAITRYSRQIAAAGEGNKQAADNFAALGISVRNSTGDLKTTEELLGDLAERFQRMPDSAQKTNAAMELLGRSGARLIPLLNGGRENIKAFTDEAQRMGLIVSADAARAAEQFNDNLLRLTKQVQGLKLAIGNNLIPVLVRLLDLFGQLGGVKLEGFDQRALERQIATLKELQRSATPGTRGFEFYAKAIAEAEGKLKTLNDAQKKVGTTKTPPITISTNAGKVKSEIQSVKNEVDNFLEGLQKQLDTIEGKKIELLFGEDTAVLAKLNQQLEQFKENLRAKNLPIPKGLDEFFGVLRDKIVDGNQALKELNDSLEETIRRQQALADEANEGVGPQVFTREDAAKRRSAELQLQEMRQRLRLEAMDTSTPEGKENQRIAQITVEFAKTAAEIDALGRQLGLSQEETAADVALAWQNALKEIGTTVNEEAERWAQAFEGAGNAILDALNDIGSGKNIKDVLTNLGRRINDELTRALVTEPLQKWIKEQAKTLAGKLFPGTAIGQGGQVDPSTRQFSTSTTTFSAAVAKFVAAVGLQGGASLGILGGGVPNIQTTPNSLGLPPELPENFDFEGWTFEITEGFGQMSESIQGGIQDIFLKAITGQKSGIQAPQPPFQFPPGSTPPFNPTGGGDGGFNFPAFIDELTEGFGQMGESIQGGIQDMTKTGTSGLEGFFKSFTDMLSQGLQSLSTGSASSGGGLLGMFGGLFGSGSDVFAGGATGYEAGFFHSGGEIGPNSPKVRIMHSGGSVNPGERLVLARDREFMFNEFSAASIGKRNLEFMNTTGRMPSESSGGAPVNVNFTVNGANDFESFRRSRATILADLTRAVAKGQKHI